MYEFLWRLPPTLYLAIQQTFRSGNRVLSLFSIVGITLSVALAVGVDMASRAVGTELDRTRDALFGAADLRIEASEGGIPEAILERVRAVPGVIAASPITSASVWLEDGFQLHIIGLDFLAEHKIHSYSIQRDGVEIQDPLRLISVPGSLVITQPLVDRLALRLGDRLSAGSVQGPTQLTVRGILASGGIADAYGGQIAAMDVYLLQALMGREGFLDAIDVVIDPSMPDGETRGRIREIVDGIARVSAAASTSSLDALTSLLRRGVAAVAAIAIIVGALVAYTTMAASVDRRVRELALIQLAGLEPRAVRLMIVSESTLSGAAGAALGTVGGLLVANAFLAFFSLVTSFVRGVEFSGVELQLRSWVIGAIVGVGASLIAVVGPARRAASARPIDVFERGLPGSPAPSSRPLLIGSACALAAVGWFGTALPGYLRLALVIGASLSACSLLISSGVRHALRQSRRLLDLAFPRIGDLVGASISARPGRAANTVVALAAITAGSLAIATTVESVTGTVDDWVAATRRGSVRVAGGTPLRLYRENLRDLAVQKIRETPGVEGLVRVKLRRSHFQGDEIVILGQDFSELVRHGSLQLTTGDEQDVLDELASGQVVVSDVFVHRFGVGAGESLVLDTPDGKQVFHVAGVLRDYSPTPGVEMTIERFDGLWPASPFRSVWVWTNADPDTIVDRIRDRTAGIQSLSFLYGDALENFGSRIFSRFSALFYLMALIAAFGGTLAAANLLLSSVLERGAELKLLRVAGVVTRQLVVAVILDALILGFMGAGIGIALGFAWVDPMLSVLSDALGWSIRYQSDWSYVLYILAATSFLALAAGLYPAWRARTAPRDLEPLVD